jgi:hypothetical protein
MRPRVSGPGVVDSREPLAITPVVALAAVWGVVALGERDRAGVRVLAATAVAAGAALLAVGG